MNAMAVLLLHNQSRAKVYRGFVSHSGSSVRVFIRLLSQTVQVLLGLGGLCCFIFFVHFLTQTPSKKKFPSQPFASFHFVLCIYIGTQQSVNINETIQDNKTECDSTKKGGIVFEVHNTYTQHTPKQDGRSCNYHLMFRAIEDKIKFLNDYGSKLQTEKVFAFLWLYSFCFENKNKIAAEIM